MTTPYIDPAVLDWLEQKFPNELPTDMPDDPREYDRLVGEQNVVRVIRNVIRRQDKDLTEVV